MTMPSNMSSIFDANSRRSSKLYQVKQNVTSMPKKIGIRVKTIAESIPRLQTALRPKAMRRRSKSDSTSSNRDYDNDNLESEKMTTMKKMKNLSVLTEGTEEGEDWSSTPSSRNQLTRRPSFSSWLIREHRRRSNSEPVVVFDEPKNNNTSKEINKKNISCKDKDIREGVEGYTVPSLTITTTTSNNSSLRLRSLPQWLVNEPRYPQQRVQPSSVDTSRDTYDRTRVPPAATPLSLYEKASDIAKNKWKNRQYSYSFTDDEESIVFDANQQTPADDADENDPNNESSLIGLSFVSEDDASSNESDHSKTPTTTTTTTPTTSRRSITNMYERATDIARSIRKGNRLYSYSFTDDDNDDIDYRTESDDSDSDNEDERSNTTRQYDASSSDDTDGEEYLAGLSFLNDIESL